MEMKRELSKMGPLADTVMRLDDKSMKITAGNISKLIDFLT